MTYTIREEDLKNYGPRHIAIILDGNGRWASNKGLIRSEGHKVGSQKVIEIAEHLSDLNIEVLSLYAFSTENWKRPKEEVNSIMSLLNSFIKKELSYLNKKDVKIQVMGDIDRLPFINKQSVQHAINKTKNNKGLILNIGLNYGSRAEIARAINLIVNDHKKGIIEEVDENILSDYLYTKDLSDPDLLIRTGGEIRLSNFMLYQLAYTEFYFTETLWPDFDKREMNKAIYDYMKRDRRFGGLNV